MLEDRDLTKDFIHLRYDPGQVTPERIVEVIRLQGFEAAIVPESKAPDKPSSDQDNR